jgi:hypothetical protein
VTDHA